MIWLLHTDSPGLCGKSIVSSSISIPATHVESGICCGSANYVPHEGWGKVWWKLCVPEVPLRFGTGLTEHGSRLRDSARCAAISGALRPAVSCGVPCSAEPRQRALQVLKNTHARRRKLFLNWKEAHVRISGTQRRARTLRADVRA